MLGFGGHHLAILQTLLVAPLRLLVVNTSFIIFMSKKTSVYFHVALGVLLILASHVTRSQSIILLYVQQALPRACGRNISCFSQVIFGDPAACSGCNAALMDGENSKYLLPCHLSVSDDSQDLPLPSLENSFTTCPLLHVLIVLSKSGLLPQPCVSLSAVHRGLLLLEVAGSLVTP